MQQVFGQVKTRRCSDQFGVFSRTLSCAGQPVFLHLESEPDKTAEVVSNHTHTHTPGESLTDCCVRGVDRTDLTSSDNSPNTDSTSIRRLAVKKDLIMFLDGEEGRREGGGGGEENIVISWL